MSSDTSLKEGPLSFTDELFAKTETAGLTFWLTPDTLTILQPQAAYETDLRNFEKVPAPKGLLRLFDKSDPILWTSVRSALAAKVLNISRTQMPSFYKAMKEFATSRQKQQVDLVWFTSRLATRSLVPLIISDLTEKELEIVLKEQEHRLCRLLGGGSKAPRKIARLMQYPTELRLGILIQTILQKRANGARAPQDDLAQTAAEFRKSLGSAGAAYIVSFPLKVRPCDKVITRYFGEWIDGPETVFRRRCIESSTAD